MQEFQETVQRDAAMPCSELYSRALNSRGMQVLRKSYVIQAPPTTMSPS